MVRMSDLVRGTPSPPRPDARPQAPADAPATRDEDAQARPRGADESAVAAARPARPRLRALATMAPPVGSAPPAPPGDERPRPDGEDTDLATGGDAFALLQRFLERVRALVKTGDALPWSDLESIIDRLARATSRSAELFWLAHAAAPAPGTDPLAFHQARVAVLALRIGATLGLGPAQLRELGSAAALIDVGLWLGDGGAGRAATESPEYRDHPRLSAGLVRRWSPPSAVIVDAILQHHELEHGQGFPQALQRDAIHVYAKVLALVDRYAALTSPAPGRGGMWPHEAMRDLVRCKTGEFSPTLIKALLAEISIFPPGTPVSLNTGEVARVIGVNRNHPLRPRVEVVADGKGQRPGVPRVIDLAETPFLYITGPGSEPR
jgi:hypothetical protein